MGLKGKAKEILGLMRAKIFGVTAGQNVYIGKHCSLKGKRHITLEDSVTVRPYTQIWSGGYGKNWKGIRNWRAMPDIYCQFSGYWRESTPLAKCVHN